MLVKSMDGHSDDIAILREILQKKDLTPTQKKQIETEISNIQKGYEGEKKAAFELDFYFKNHKNMTIIHDLRIEHDGRVAQIDHLIIDRLFNFYVLESKFFSDEIIINEQGEFSAKYNNKTIGIPSPIAQNERHIDVLRSLLRSNKVKRPMALGFRAKPIFHNLITLSSNVNIVRPKDKNLSWLNKVMKIDQFIDFMVKDANKPYVTIKEVFSVTQLLFREELYKFSEDLALQHTPIKIDWYARFGLKKPNYPDPVTHESKATPKKNKSEKKYICASCATNVELIVARFCWFNKKRFNSQIYCRSCQGQFQA